MDFRKISRAAEKDITDVLDPVDKAGKAGVEAGIAAGAKTMMGLIPYEIRAMKAVVAEKIRLFDSDGKY